MIESPRVVAHCPSRIPGICRGPACPRSWRTISSVCPQPLEWPSDRWPPLVFTGSCPSTAQRPAELDAPAGDPVGGLARGAEAKALERPEHLGREAVVAVQRLDLSRR